MATHTMLENPMHREDWQYIVHSVTKSGTQLSMHARRKVKVKVKVAQSCLDSLRPHGLYSLWNSPGQDIGVGSLSFLQGIFPTQRANPGLPHCRQILYQRSHKGSPRILEWVAYPFCGSCINFLSAGKLLLQTSCLKTVQICYFMALEVRSLKQVPSN